MTWGHTGVLLQGSAKMALVGKSRTQRDLRNGSVRIQKPMACRLDAQLAQIVSDTAEVAFAERARQMDRMDAHLRRQPAEHHRFLKPGVQNLCYSAEPITSAGLEPRR